MKFSKCEFADCEQGARVKGLCPTHYEQQRQGRTSRPSGTQERQQCAVSHCSIEANTDKPGALCDPHYQVKYRGTDPESRIVRPTRSGTRYDTACSLDGCPRRAVTKSLCKNHYTMARRGQIEVPAALGVELHPVCAIEECNRISYGKGLCRPHGDQIKSGRPIKDPQVWGKYTKLHPCHVEGCDMPAISRDLCSTHISRANAYGLTADELSKIHAIKVCENPACTSGERMAIDHDHATGAVRGRLCQNCNIALGFAKDNKDVLIGLVQYLMRHELSLTA